MGEFTLPVAPVALTAILGLLAPYVVAIVNRPQWSPNVKRIVAVVAVVVLTAVALVLFYAATKEPVPEWPQLVLLAVVVSQAAYALILKPTAAALESKSDEWFHPGTSLRRDRE